MQKTLSVIDLSAIRANALTVRKMLGDRFFFAVVKADAYGHGAEKVAAELQDICDGFCVAICDEGVALRLSGITKPILVLAPPINSDDAEKIKFYSLTATVSSVSCAKLLNGCRCHIAVNTGMNRYGCSEKELKQVLDILDPSLIDGVYSHLYAAENKDECERQYAAFSKAVKEVKKVNCDVIAHLAASGGILRGGKYLFDGARCGIMLYGYAPAGFKRGNLRPALSVFAPLAQEVEPFGRGVGYNIADRRYKKLYTYRLGYADGFFRIVPLGEKTLCMDAFISTEKRALMPVMCDADEYAKRCGTISYEVLCSVTARSEKIYERRAEIQI